MESRPATSAILTRLLRLHLQVEPDWTARSWGHSIDVAYSVTKVMCKLILRAVIEGKNIVYNMISHKLKPQIIIMFQSKGTYITGMGTSMFTTLYVVGCGHYELYKLRLRIIFYFPKFTLQVWLYSMSITTLECGPLQPSYINIAYPTISFSYGQTYNKSAHTQHYRVHGLYSNRS